MHLLQTRQMRIRGNLYNISLNINTNQRYEEQFGHCVAFDWTCCPPGAVLFDIRCLLHVSVGARHASGGAHRAHRSESGAASRALCGRRLALRLVL